MNGTALTVANVTTLASKELTVELFNIMNAINEVRVGDCKSLQANH